MTALSLRFGARLRAYDINTGQVEAGEESEAPQVGTLFDVGDAAVALYCSEGELYIQAERSRFAVMDPTLVVSYGHDWANSITRFSISSETLTWQTEYPSWWSLEHLSPDEVMFAPERDSDEDSAAFLRDVCSSSSHQHRLVQRWCG
ncbi:MAG: hypothetical protein ACI9MR_000752 [Myxococcota bacterium]|jgi:hypothetical protein